MTLDGIRARIIMITHRLETLKFYNYVYKIENGKLFKVEN
jgi:ABC-type multidrug transport system fused ATPase/permease subunit